MLDITRGAVWYCILVRITAPYSQATLSQGKVSFYLLLCNVIRYALRSAIRYKNCISSRSRVSRNFWAVRGKHFGWNAFRNCAFHKIFLIVLTRRLPQFANWNNKVYPIFPLLCGFLHPTSCSPFLLGFTDNVYKRISRYT